MKSLRPIFAPTPSAFRNFSILLFALLALHFVTMALLFLSLSPDTPEKHQWARAVGVQSISLETHPSVIALVWLPPLAIFVLLLILWRKRLVQLLAIFSAGLGVLLIVYCTLGLLSGSRIWMIYIYNTPPLRRGAYVAVDSHNGGLLQDFRYISGTDGRPTELSHFKTQFDRGLSIANFQGYPHAFQGVAGRLRPYEIVLRTLGIEWNFVGPPYGRVAIFVMPFWLAIALCTVLPLMVLLRHHRNRKLPAFACIKCGYDLRAHKPGDRCPECGTLIPAA